MDNSEQIHTPNGVGVLPGVSVQPVSPVLPVEVPPVSKRKRWKKVLLVLVSTVLVLGVVVFNIPRILSLLFPGDAELLEQSTLTLKPVVVPDEENGYYDLHAINGCIDADFEHCTSLIALPEGFSDIAYTNYVDRIAWDQSVVDQVLRMNAPALALFAQAASKPFVQVPALADPESLRTFQLPLYPLNRWRAAARLQAIRALSLSYQGKTDEAIQEAAVIHQVGQRVALGHNGLMGYLVGIAMQTLGADTIREIIPYGTPTVASLRVASQILADSTGTDEGLRDALRGEYTHTAYSVSFIRSELDAYIQQGVAAGETPTWYAKHVQYGYYFKPNQTINLYTQLYAKEVAAVGKQCALPELKAELEMGRASAITWKLPFTENAIGKLLFDTTGISLDSALTRSCEAVLVSRVAQTQLALRAYKIQNGALPTRLDELVPKYLAAVPEDPFDQQPIRYDATKKILYSMGLQKQDRGGSTGPGWTKMDNPTFPIAF